MVRAALAIVVSLGLSLLSTSAQDRGPVGGPERGSVRGSVRGAERGPGGPYRPERSVSGVVRLWGHGSPQTDFMGELVKTWEDGFRRYHPAIEFDNRMYGTASAIGALYAGVGDVAILGREIRPFEVTAFERVTGYPPLGVDIATGSLDVRNFDFALVVFVHKDNPISSLTLGELDAIFGCEHRRSVGNLSTWGALGATGDWANQSIRPYGSRISGGFAVFFQDVVMQGSGRWNPAMKELFDVRQPDGSLLDSGQQVLDAIAKDRFGIGVSSLHYRNPDVKPLSLALDHDSPAYAATREHLIDRTYPLTRFIPAFVNRRPGAAVDPKVKEFLRYILSREGQEDIMRDGRYLPLSAAAIAEQRMKLE